MLNLESVIQNKDLLSTYRNYNLLWEQNIHVPYYNYFGINFNGSEIVSIKFYFHTFKELSKNQLLQFIPTDTDFNQYYSYHIKSDIQNIEHSGCAFEVKFYKDIENLVKGFHFRIPYTVETLEKIGKPQFLGQAVNFKIFNIGINYEYFPNNPLRKTYFYFNQPKDIEYFSDRFKQDCIRNAKLVEYSESETFSKINTWYGRNHILTEKANTFEYPIKQIIQDICFKYNLKATSFGFYENKNIKSVYFVDADPQKPLYYERNPELTYTNTFKNLLKL
ncbi:MAG TPA: hypothetical protein PLP27_00710 [Crocinitomicaceae bacterium]|nr:hypothetical protein [Crocinitomicaceae bacterium]